MSDGLKRRDFLKVVGVGGRTGATVAGCSTDKVERLIPYVVPPEEITPGVATWYASTCGECASGCGIRVRTREGRAVMIEGNPDHPVSRGGLCSRGVSALQGLYNPDRVATPLRAGADGFEAITWDEALALLAGEAGDGGALALPHRAKRDHRGGAAERLSSRRWAGTASSTIRWTIPALRSGGRDRLRGGRPAPLRHRRGRLPGLVRRRFPRDVDLAGAFRRGLCGNARGGSRREGQVRLRRAAPVADGPERRRVDTRAGRVRRRTHRAWRSRASWCGAARTRARTRKWSPEYTLEDAAEEAGVEAGALAGLADRFAQAVGAGARARAGGAPPGRHRGQPGGSDPERGGGEPGTDPARRRVARDGIVVVRGDGGRHLPAMQRGQSTAWRSCPATNPAYSLPPGSGFRDAFAAVPFKVAFATALDETSALADLVLPDAHPLGVLGGQHLQRHAGGGRSRHLRGPAAGHAARSRCTTPAPWPTCSSTRHGDVWATTSARRTFHEYLRAAHDAWLAQNGEAGRRRRPGRALARGLLRSGSIVSYAGRDPRRSLALQAPTTAVEFRHALASEATAT